ncbi:MAG: adenosylcobalamin-dependent ribonucleoside-diphosphate reductase [Candidatus Marsarchaeota archaeon]|nr:adenosylcobalamin-dependent ribonucleoside-diphosphate reductase [Candidatus Marsarchaeota archaeon]MCL5112823.1 adenosylcobalamin-dependent ribonucleoside-diphosphate reductase [Candidatus Marsarchaeota archaeon]
MVESEEREQEKTENKFGKVEANAEDLPKETLDFFHGDEIRARVFYEKYAFHGENLDGPALEKTPVEMWKRVAREIAAVEATDAAKSEWEEKFYWLMKDFRFVPGGRILFGAGSGRRVTLLNCYVIPMKEDNIESIFDWCKEAARTYSFGGGVGGDISVLRPKNAPVNNSAMVSSGSVSFMNLMSETTHVIGQHGRRGALMITLDVSHPDIFDFVKVKRDTKSVRYANISVKITDEFMKAVESDSEFTLKFENPAKPLPDGNVSRIERKIRARDLWNELIKSARDWAEPGLVFWDTMKRMSPSEYNGMNILSTNPCSEQPLQAYGACDLGNINLSYFVTKPFQDSADLNWEELDRTVRYGVRFLDNVIEYNMDKHPLKEQREAAENSRRIGLGVTGLADMLIKLKIKYDSDKALAFVDNLFNRIKRVAYDESTEIAKEKGTFKMFDKDKHLKMQFVMNLDADIRDKISKNGLRNVAILTIPPVGSGSVLAGTSSGIEPVFAFSYTRRSESLSKENFKVYHPLVVDYMASTGISDEKDLPDFFIPSHQINPEFRVKMQGVIQRHVDSAISSTVNLPSDATVETVGKIYMQAWKTGCKGITVYREGSREGVLITDEAKEKAAQPAQQQKPLQFNWPRPPLLYGSTVKLNVQQGTLYITANFDEESRVREVFVDLGKGGTEDKSYCEAIGRMLSKYLQQGGNVREAINSLKGIRSNNVFWNNGLKLYSIPDAIAKGLEMIMTMQARGAPQIATPNMQPGQQLPLAETDLHSGASDEVQHAMPSGGAQDMAGLSDCPQCHEHTLVNENGCYICKSCGYTKCE